MTSVTFTSSGSWAAAAATADCQAWGESGTAVAGAAGSGGHSGGGAGSGAYAEETALAVSGTISFTIGSGGTATNTSFPGTSVTVTAAHGGNASGSSGGARGAAGSNAIAFDGAAGGPGASGTGNKGGGGGAGAAGTSGAGADGGAGSGVAGGTAGTAGTGGGAGGAGDAPLGSGGSAGNAPGGGPGGGHKTNSASGSAGAATAGQITLTYTANVAGTATLAGVGTLTAQGSIAGTATLAGVGTLTAQQAGAGVATLAGAGTLTAHAKLGAGATLAGAGTLTAFGSTPQPAVVNQWAGGYGQGTTFTSITSALQSAVVPLTLAFSVGGGSGTPTAGNWLFCIASWTQDPSIAEVHVGTGDDIHSYWRQYPASQASGLTRTAISYTPNIARVAGNVYVAPDMEIAACNVLIVEVSGLGPWDTVTGPASNYAAAATSVSLSLGAPSAAAFWIGAAGGDNISSGQAFLPSGWTGLVTQTQTNGSNALADNILTAAYLASSSTSHSVSGTSSSPEDMSGFMLAVLVVAPSPIPATQNPSWPYVIFEAGFGSGFNTPDSEITWTDLSSRLWNWDETTGVQFQLGELQATNLMAQIDDVDGYLISTNTASPYYPNVMPGTPLRIRAALGTLGGVVTNRWYILQRNAAEWGDAIDEQFRRYSDITGTDLWAALSTSPPGFYRAEVFEDLPYAWWPLDDQPGTAGILPVQMLNAALGNTNTLNVTLSPNGATQQPVYDTDGNSLSGGVSGGEISGSIAVYTTGANSGWMFGDPVGSPPSYGTGNPTSAQPGSASWQQAGHAGTTGSYGWYLICNDASFPALSGGITVEGWFSYQYFGSDKGYVPSGQSGFASACQQPYCPVTLLELATASNPVAILQLNLSGHLNLITYNGSTPTTHAVYTASDLRSNSWFMVTLTATTTAWTVWVNGGATAQVSGSATGMTSAWTYLIANADFGSAGGTGAASVQHSGNAAISHIAVYPVILPYYRIMDHYWAAVTAFGQVPAPSGVAIQWVGPAGFGGGDAYPPDGSVNLGSYTANTNPSASAIVVANVSGSLSGPSARAAGTSFAASGSEWFVLWVGWNGVAAAFDLYTASSLGSETEAAVVAGGGDSFTSGYGASASGHGIAQVTSGDGSSPPASPSSIGDTAGQRIERLMRAGRVTSPSRCIDPASLLVQAPGTAGGGTQAGQGIQAIQQSDNGLLFVDNCNNLSYWERPHLAGQYSSPVWTLGPDTGLVPYYKEVRWVTDPQRIYNAITIAPQSPTGAALPLITPADATTANASQAAYGPQPLQVISWLQSTSEMQAQANWLLSVFGTPRRRVENVMIDAGPYPAAWVLVMGINIGDVVTLQDWQIGGGGTTHTYRVTELKRRLDRGSHNQQVTGHVLLTLDYEPTSYWS